jgi:hypothetical protein
MTDPTPAHNPKPTTKEEKKSSNPVLDSKSPELQSPDAKSRRREQVRRAQRYASSSNHTLISARTHQVPLITLCRTHRDRKATYVKALELEVAKMRARDVAHDEEARSYREIIRRLRDLLISHHIQIPSDLPQVSSDSPLAMIEVLGTANEPQQLRAHMPTFDATAPYPFQRDTGKQPEIQSPQQFHSQTSPLPNFPHITGGEPVIQGPSSQSYGLDTSQVGIDFVLALEHPCLYHHQLPNAQLDGTIGTGHELMVQSPVMRAAPPLELQGKEPRLPASSKWNVPAGELEKLLNYSQGLDLEGELTPIQAWQRIRAHPSFLILTPAALEKIKERLLKFVKCYG